MKKEKRGALKHQTTSVNYLQIEGITILKIRGSSFADLVGMKPSVASQLHLPTSVLSTGANGKEVGEKAWGGFNTVD